MMLQGEGRPAEAAAAWQQAQGLEPWNQQWQGRLPEAPRAGAAATTPAPAGK
jgi:hypothetical protein